jgi:hypothetical protein
MTYGQGRLVSNIDPGQSSALRPISIQTLTEIKLYMVDKIKHIFLVLILPTKSMFKNKKLCRIQHT